MISSPVFWLITLPLLLAAATALWMAFEIHSLRFNRIVVTIDGGCVHCDDPRVVIVDNNNGT